MSSVRTVVLVAGLLAVASVAPATALASDATDLASGATDGSEDLTRGVTGDLPGDDRRQPSPGSPDVVQTVTYRLLPDAPGRIGMTVTYRPDGDVSALVMYGSSRRVLVESDGFDRQPNGRWVWNRSVSSPSATFEVAVNRSGPTFRGLGWVDAGEWALARPEVSFAYRLAAERRWAYSWRESDRIERRTRIEGNGFAGSSMLYLGPHDTTTATLRNASVRIVEPAAANATDLDRRIASVERAAAQLEVGARDPTVNVFVGPSPLRRGGITVAGGRGAQDVWVSARSPVDPANNTWIHEYVHTRQEFALGSGMRWFREASASYYAGLLSVRQGIGGREGFDAFVTTLAVDDSSDAVLTNRSAWADPYTPYGKGTRVLAALDARIRNETDRRRTLQDVFRRMNAHEGRVGYDDFARIVANVSGNSQRAWLDRHLAGRVAVSPPVDPYAYTATDPASDADGDGVTDLAEREFGAHPFDADSDGDGLADGAEIRNGTDPTAADTDGDGLPDGLERERGSDPTDPTDPFLVHTRYPA